MRLTALLEALAAGGLRQECAQERPLHRVPNAQSTPVGVFRTYECIA
jgi:hypothetical protein